MRKILFIILYSFALVYSNCLHAELPLTKAMGSIQDVGPFWVSLPIGTKTATTNMVDEVKVVMSVSKVWKTYAFYRPKRENGAEWKKSELSINILQRTTKQREYMLKGMNDFEVYWIFPKSNKLSETEIRSILLSVKLKGDTK